MKRDRWRSLVTRHGGAAVAALYVLHRLLQTASGGRAGIVPYLLVAQPVGNPALRDVRPSPDTVVERVGATHPVVAEFPRPPQVVAQRFADGAECHVAFVKSGFGGHIWIARGVYVEDEVRCRFVIVEPASGVWDYDVYVPRRLRLGRTMGRLWKAVDDALAAEGVRWSYSRINRFSARSVQSHQRLGAVTVARVVFVVLGPLQLAFGGRGIGVQLHGPRGRGPEIRLHPPTPAAPSG